MWNWNWVEHYFKWFPPAHLDHRNFNQKWEAWYTEGQGKDPTGQYQACSPMGLKKARLFSFRATTWRRVTKNCLTLDLCWMSLHTLSSRQLLRINRDAITWGQATGCWTIYKHFFSMQKWKCNLQIQRRTDQHSNQLKFARSCFEIVTKPAGTTSKEIEWQMRDSPQARWHPPVSTITSICFSPIIPLGTRHYKILVQSLLNATPGEN